MPCNPLSIFGQDTHCTQGWTTYHNIKERSLFRWAGVHQIRQQLHNEPLIADDDVDYSHWIEEVNPNEER